MDSHGPAPADAALRDQPHILHRDPFHGFGRMFRALRTMWRPGIGAVFAAVLGVALLSACATTGATTGGQTDADASASAPRVDGIPVPELPPEVPPEASAGSEDGTGPEAIGTGVDPRNLVDAVERRKAQLEAEYAAQEDAYRAEIRRLEHELGELPRELARRRENLDASLTATLKSIRDSLLQAVAARRARAVQTIAETRDPAMFFTNREYLERLAEYETRLKENFSVTNAEWYDPELPTPGDPAARAVEVTPENAIAFMAYKWQLLRAQRYPEVAAASLRDVSAEVTRLFPDLAEAYYFASFVAPDTIAALGEARNAAALEPATRAFQTRVSVLTAELEAQFLEAVKEADTNRIDAIWEEIDVFAIRTVVEPRTAGDSSDRRRVGPFLFAMRNNLDSLEHMLGKLDSPRRQAEAQRILAAAVERRDGDVVPVTVAAGASLPQLREETQTALDRALRIERRIRLTRIVQLVVGIPALGTSIYSGIAGVRNYQDYQQADDYFTAFESRLSAERASEILTVSGSLTLASVAPTPFVLRGDRGSDELRDTLNYIDRQIAAVAGGQS